MAPSLIDVDEGTFTRIRLAARMAGLTDGEVVARAIEAYVAEEPAAPPPDDRWALVPVYGVYRGVRVEGLYTPATQRLAVTSDPLEGQAFKSPSGAARAVIAALNPERAVPSVSGWLFWRVVETDARLEALRRG